MRTSGQVNLNYTYALRCALSGLVEASSPRLRSRTVRYNFLTETSRLHSSFTIRFFTLRNFISCLTMSFVALHQHRLFEQFWSIFNFEIIFYNKKSVPIWQFSKSKGLIAIRTD